MNEMTSLHDERLDHALAVIKSTGARRVLDLGCGPGMLLYRLLAEPQFIEVTGVERSATALSQARAMLEQHLDGDCSRLTLLQDSYADNNPLLTGYDAAAMVETIEHVEPSDLSTVERTVFGRYRPRFLFMTTPNSEYNPLFDLPNGTFREPDHRFEWNRAKFRQWAGGVASRNQYRVRFSGIGEHHPDFGQPTQTALFNLLPEAAVTSSPRKRGQ